MFLSVFEGFECFEGFEGFCMVFTFLFEEIVIFLKLKLCCSNQDQFRTQRPGLFKNTVILGRKPGVVN